MSKYQCGKYRQDQPGSWKQIDQRQKKTDQPQLPAMATPQQPPFLRAGVFTDGIDPQHASERDRPPENGKHYRHRRDKPPRQERKIDVDGKSGRESLDMGVSGN